MLGTLDAETVGALVAGAPVPADVLAGPGCLPVPALAALGVARVSAGSAIAEAAYGLVARGPPGNCSPMARTGLWTAASRTAS